MFGTAAVPGLAPVFVSVVTFLVVTGWVKFVRPLRTAVVSGGITELAVM